MKYVYSFVVWPNEKQFSQALFDFFRIFRHRTEMHFTEAEFARFRSGMEGDGFTLREVTRTPYLEPEDVP